jgi:PAS domain S-box-containing protein
VLAEWNKLVQATVVVEFEGRVICKDGSEKWFAWTAHVEGEAIYLIAHVVTTHDKTEETIHESEEQFRSFFEQPLIGMAITSPTKGVLVVNDKLCEMLDYSREELLRVTWAEITHPDDLALDVAHFERVVAGEIDSYSIDKRFIRRDGRYLHTIMSCHCLRDRQHHVVHFVALVQDITERKQLEAELRRSLERERDLSSLKTRFVSLVSHEFRNPLATILVSTNLLQKYSYRMSEARKREHLARIQTQIQRLTGLLGISSPSIARRPLVSNSTRLVWT